MNQELRGGIRSLEKGLKLLTALQDGRGSMRLNEIAAAGGMTPSMAHGYLVSLIRAGFVLQDRSTGLYDLGDAALQLGLTALRRADFLTFARTTMSDLAAQLGETVTLAVWSEQGPVVVDKIEGRRDSIYEIRAGSRVQLWPTATGRVFMAHLSPELWRGHLKAVMQQAGRTQEETAAFTGALSEVVAQGFAATLPATLPDFSAIAVPVLDHQARLKGVITVLGRAENFDVSPEGGTVATVCRAASALNARLGAPRD